jgi:hypothetical protein
MQVLKGSLVLALALALTAGALPAAAQTTTSSATMSQADLDRLQWALEDARNDIGRSRVGTNADQLRRELDELGEEVIYLKVRLRKERNVPRSEYVQLRDRIDDLRNRTRSTSSSAGTTSTSARSGSTSSTSTGTFGSGTTSSTAGTSDTGQTTVRRSAPNEIPVGTEFDVRLQTALNSGTAQVEDRFEATTLVDLYQDERVLVPAGSVLRGVVSTVDAASRTDRKGAMTLSFDQITVNGRAYPLRATVTQALESEGLKGEAGRIATGAGVGAIIGGILGGFKGALAGILIGGGGTIIATEGKDVNLPAGTVLRVRLDSPVTVGR